MKSEKEMDDLLKKVASKVNEKVIDDLENKVDYSYEFSDDFKEKMKLISKAQREKRRKKKYIYSIPTFAMVCVLAIVIFNQNDIITMADKYVAQKEEHQTEESIQNYYGDNGAAMRIILSDLTYLPEGYRKDTIGVVGNMGYINYVNENKDVIFFKQVEVISGMTLVYDGEYDTCEMVEINGIDCKIYTHDNGRINATFEIGQRIYSIYTSNISIDEMYKIIEGIE